jgi:hypothetical protein
MNEEKELRDRLQRTVDALKRIENIKINKRDYKHVIKARLMAAKTLASLTLENIGCKDE